MFGYFRNTTLKGQEIETLLLTLILPHNNQIHSIPANVTFYYFKTLSSFSPSNIFPFSIHFFLANLKGLTPPLSNIKNVTVEEHGPKHNQSVMLLMLAEWLLTEVGIARHFGEFGRSSPILMVSN